MKIIIAGAGRIGYTIAAELSKERHDITVIDHDSDRTVDVVNTLDVITMSGNGASFDVLEEAGAEKADLLIAVTEADETNLLICLTAKKIGVPRTIARVRNREYYKLASLLKEDLGLSMTINPEELTANEISRILRFPAASKVEPFANGKAESVEIKIVQDSPLNGLQLSNFRNKITDKVLVCAVARGNEVYIPRGDFTIQAGDRLNIIGGYKDINSFLKRNNNARHGIKTIMVFGGGMIALYLSRQLVNTGMKLKIIERNDKACAAIKTYCPKAELVHADGTRSDVLNEEGLSSADAFVAITGDDEDNVITSMYASSLGVSKVITKVNESHIIKMLVGGSLDSVLQPSSIATQNIVQYVRSMQNAYDSSVDTLYYMFEGNVETLEFKVNDSFTSLDIPLKRLHVSHDALIAAIIRDGVCIIPSGDDEIHSGDSVIVTTVRNGTQRLEDVVEARL